MAARPLSKAQGGGGLARGEGRWADLDAHPPLLAAPFGARARQRRPNGERRERRPRQLIARRPCTPFSIQHAHNTTFSPPSFFPTFASCSPPFFSGKQPPFRVASPSFLARRPFSNPPQNVALGALLRGARAAGARPPRCGGPGRHGPSRQGARRVRVAFVVGRALASSLGICSLRPAQRRRPLRGPRRHGRESKSRAISEYLARARGPFGRPGGPRAEAPTSKN